MTTPQAHNAPAVAAVVGTFDGVHRGHRYLLDCLRDEAARRGLSTRVYTFADHPLATIAPDRAPRLLLSPADKTKRLLAAGIDDVRTDDFPSVRPLTARQYITRLAAEGVRLLLVGHDNRFGSDGLHTVAEFEAAAEGTGVTILQAPELTVAGEGAVSSSAIRRLIAEGDVSGASRLLGYPYRLDGTVEHGRRLGHTIGFPTANLRPADDRRLIPAHGVYAARAITPDGTFPAMVNIGSRPTVDTPDAPVTIEAHIIGYDGDLYGRPITLEFVDRLRSEMRFPDVGALARQLEADRRATLEAINTPRSTF